MMSTVLMLLAVVIASGPPQEAEPTPEEMAAPALSQEAEPSIEPREPAPAAPTPAVSPEAAEDAVEAGLALFARRRYRQAEEAFREALAADPSSAAAAFYLGYALYKIAEPTRRLTPEKREAAEMFAKAFDVDPSFRPVWAKK